MNPIQIKYIPWDSVALGTACYEIEQIADNQLVQLVLDPGHYTAKIDPLASKEQLHTHGFYYCDTLLEPYCSRQKIKLFAVDGIELSNEIRLEDLLPVCNGAFSHGRFHRDFHFSAQLADLRYNNWFKQLYQEENIYGFLYYGDIAGFICCHENKLVLHAMAPAYRGKGLAKYFWSAVCQQLFNAGHMEIKSSISAANTAVLNLYTSLGFRFRNPIDIYHRVVP